MRGLLYKEYYMLRPQLKSWLAFLLFFTVYSFVFKSVGMLTMMLAVIGITSCYNSFHYDKQYRCDEYIAAMPVSRGQMVASKYMFSLSVDLLIAAVTAVIILVSCTVPALNIPLDEAMGAAGGVLAVTVLIQAVTIPLIYILGVEKARYVNMIIWMAPWVLIMLNRDRLPDITENQIMGLLKLAPMAILAVLVVSWLISTAVFKKRDL